MPTAIPPESVDVLRSYLDSTQAPEEVMDAWQDILDGYTSVREAFEEATGLAVSMVSVEEVEPVDDPFDKRGSLRSAKDFLRELKGARKYA